MHSRARAARRILSPPRTKGQQYHGRQTSAWGPCGGKPGIPKLHLIGIKQSGMGPFHRAPKRGDPLAWPLLPTLLAQAPSSHLFGPPHAHSAPSSPLLKPVLSWLWCPPCPLPSLPRHPTPRVPSPKSVWHWGERHKPQLFTSLLPGAPRRGLLPPEGSVYVLAQDTGPPFGAHLHPRQQLGTGCSRLWPNHTNLRAAQTHRILHAPEPEPYPTVPFSSNAKFSFASRETPRQIPEPPENVTSSGKPSLLFWTPCRTFPGPGQRLNDVRYSTFAFCVPPHPPHK